MTPSFARSLLLPLGVALMVIAPSAAQAGAVPVVPFLEISQGTLGKKGDAAFDEDGTVCADPCEYAPLTPEERQQAAEAYKIEASSAGSQETSGTSEASSAAPEESTAASEASSAAPEESTAASEASSEETTANEESTESEWSDDE